MSPTSDRLAGWATLLGATPASRSRDPQTNPHDQGRTSRLARGELRAFLLARDGGCVFPYCDTPPARCELHHIRAFKDGGPTSAHNLAALCVLHHALCQHPPGDPHHWTIRMADDGVPEAIPPVTIDAAQRPIRHPRLRR